MKSTENMPSIIASAVESKDGSASRIVLKSKDSGLKIEKPEPSEPTGKAGVRVRRRRRIII